ncbi:MAG TPA: cytochrome b N-terminal domain-containing protein [Chloroflexota bacterium]|nr:cytochrome b N-terminal domain-containing protein [Chloroflexota bacterium]
MQLPAVLPRRPAPVTPRPTPPTPSTPDHGGPEGHAPRVTRTAAVADWLDERLAYRGFVRAIFLRRVPVGLTWWYSLGAATLFVISIQFATGVLLAMNYAPTPDQAYDSVAYVTRQMPFGWFVRGLHHWGASAMVVLVIAHMVTAFILGAQRYPREVTWLVGVLLLLITLGFGFTGYLLPWDQKAFWATTVGTNIAGTIPVLGSYAVRIMRGGTQLGAVALSRFYALHVLVLPLSLGAFALIHLALVIYHGVSVPPKLWNRGPKAPAAGSTNGTARIEYLAAYHAHKARGPRFWPEVILHDLRLSVVIVLALVALTVVVGAPLEDRADPSDTAYIPRPEWYFLWLFELLKFFPGHLEWVGAVIVPGLLVGLLILAPFISRGAERRPLRRPLGMATLTILLGGIAFLTYRGAASTPPAKVEEHGIVLTSVELRGRQVIAQQGCQSCHVVNGKGDARKGPPLDGIRDRLTPADIHFYMERPEAMNPHPSMKPLIPPLTHQDVDAITQYLLTLEEGRAPSPQEVKK